MTGFLETLERQLVEVAERGGVAQRGGGAEHGEGAAAQSSRSRVHKLPLRALALAGAIALLLTAVALAASGVLLPGSPVPATPDLSPNVSLGVPAPGHSRLMRSSAPDPAGGLPWSMRIVHTTRRLVCVQIGRLYHGQIGVVGEQGAFHDDGRFHPLLPDAISKTPRGYASICQPDVDTFSLQASGVPQSGELPRLGNPDEPERERRLYFGLLGPDAVSVTYRRGRRQTTVPVERGSGAYLIVLPSSHRPPPATVLAGKTGTPLNHGRLVAEGAITAIAYRTKDGTCVESWSPSERASRCPHPKPPNFARRPSLPIELHQPIHVRLLAIHGNPLAGVPTKSGRPLAPPSGAVGGVYYEAIVSFRAPFAVNSALSGYEVTLPAIHPWRSQAAHCDTGSDMRLLERNVRAGQIVNVHIEDVFANECPKGVTIEVRYHKGIRDSPMLGGREVLVGRTTIPRP